MLSHEELEVINQPHNKTVSYVISLRVWPGNYFTDIFCVSIEVEIAHYETATAWLKDLMYVADFSKDR